MAKYVERVNLQKPEKAKKYLYAKDFNLYREARKIIDSGRIMTPTIQEKLEKLGFSLNFRGFNSHRGDCYLYAYNGKYYLSFGMSNINKAGRGYEVQVKPKCLKFLN